MKPIGRFLSLPSWAVVRAMRRFLPEEHAWKHRKFSLLDWHLGATEVTARFDLVLWSYFLFLVWLAMWFWKGC